MTIGISMDQENCLISRDGTVKLSGGDQGIRKSTSIRDHSERGEERRVDLRGESDGSQPTDTMMDDTAIH